MAAAFVYVASYLIIFNILGLPTRNQEGWLGAPLRLLQTGPLMERNGAIFYRGDTGPYKLFKPLNTAWLKTKTLPEVSAEPPGEEASGGEGRRGRRGGEGGLGSEGRGEGRTTGTAGERGGRRGGPAVDGATTGTIDREPEAADEAGTSSDNQPRRRGRRGPANDDQETATERRRNRGPAPADSAQ